ncbi:hypothetical protein [Spirosoma flavum]|uniref:Uncharacterized protein n=1 Tax=Spirosoma flavum TaxID=2048557 RepID=A0ABW6APC2_9BACT
MSKKKNVPVFDLSKEVKAGFSYEKAYSLIRVRLSTMSLVLIATILTYYPF